MSKNTKLVITLVVILLLIIALYFFVISRGRNTINNNTPSQSPTSVPSTNTNKGVGETKKTFPIPTKDDTKMTLKTEKGDVPVNNLYKNPVEKLSDNGVAFVENNDFHMLFYPQDQGFIIAILNPNIQVARDKAENDFLNSLGITKDQACKLTVDLGVPVSVNREAAGKNYGLSFCPNGKPFPKQ